MGFLSKIIAGYKLWNFSRYLTKEKKLLDQLEQLIDGESIEAQRLKTSFDRVKNETDHNKRAINYLAFRNELSNFEHFEHYMEKIDKQLSKIMHSRLKEATK